MDSTLIILGLDNELNLGVFKIYFQRSTRNLTNHETPRANFRPRVPGGQRPRAHGVSREFTPDPVRTGVKRPVHTGCPERFPEPLGPYRHEVTIEGYHEEYFTRL